MQKKLFLIFIMSCLSCVMIAQTTELKFGYVSYSKIMKAMPQYVKAQASLNELKSNYDKELKRSEQAFNKQFEEYVDGQKSFPENILIKRQKELQQLMEQSVAFKQESQRLLAKAENELMQPVKEHLKALLAEIGKEKGYPYIINTDNEAYLFINPELGEDMTNEVISALNK